MEGNENNSGPRHRGMWDQPDPARGLRPSRLGLAATIAVPTVCLIAAAAVLSNSANAAIGDPAPVTATATVAAAAATLPAAATPAATQPAVGAAATTQPTALAAADQAANGNHPAMPRPDRRGSAAQAAAANVNCTLIVPANPLSAAGLATPYQLVATNPRMGPCNEANMDQTAFVQGAIVTPAGQLTLYDPLVIDQGTMPAATPAPAVVPAGATVALWFGFNGTALTLQSAAGTNSLAAGNCVNGLNGSNFGQFADCNAPAFFQVAVSDAFAGSLKIPAAGTANDGLPCSTVRSFALVDQDQSDNVNTHYLASANGRIAQNNAAGRAAIGLGAVDLANGSDNRLLTEFVSPNQGCKNFTAPNGANDGTPTASLPLQELSAAVNQLAPIALVPLTDPMTLVDAKASAAKTNLFRVAVDQTPIGAAADDGNGTTYCSNLFNNAAGIRRVFADKATVMNGPSPNPAAATNLFTFLAMRASDSFVNLNCAALLRQPNPITLTVVNNIVTDAVIAPVTATTTQQRRHRRGFGGFGRG